MDWELLGYVLYVKVTGFLLILMLLIIIREFLRYRAFLARANSED